MTVRKTTPARPRPISPHINGVAGDAYLEGDGSVTFTLDFVSAISAFANAFGHYEVAADTRLGFFMIQDGFDQFGALPTISRSALRIRTTRPRSTPACRRSCSAIRAAHSTAP